MTACELLAAVDFPNQGRSDLFELWRPGPPNGANRHTPRTDPPRLNQKEAQCSVLTLEWKRLKRRRD